jgi:zinc D-Ala-D-Ala carboxypeptidase
MSQRGPARSEARRRRLAILAALVCVSATLAGVARHAIGGADGVAPVGWTASDDQVPVMANLDPRLREALRRAAADAATGGIEIRVTSGWRSPEQQKRLFRRAVSKYGSKASAARWVATPDTSSHVRGRAVDVGPARAAAWLSRHGAAYGLCRIYQNEPWHYELRPEARADGCPSRYADPAHDPRMQP